MPCLSTVNVWNLSSQTDNNKVCCPATSAASVRLRALAVLLHNSDVVKMHSAHFLEADSGLVGWVANDEGSEAHVREMCSRQLKNQMQSVPSRVFGHFNSHFQTIVENCVLLKGKLIFFFTFAVDNRVDPLFCLSLIAAAQRLHKVYLNEQLVNFFGRLYLTQRSEWVTLHSSVSLSR